MMTFLGALMIYLSAKGTPLPLLQNANNWNVTRSGSRLNGTSNNDVFYAGNGDTMVGGAGDDQYSVWSNAFKIIERPGEGIDTLYSYAYGNVTLPDQVENLVLSGPGATGGFGNAMANVIIAGTVGAYLDGGVGDDVLVGGAGLDTFAVRAGNGSDAIENFSTSIDLIRLDGYAINGFAQLKAAMTQVGGDVRVALPNGEELVIRGVAASALSASNFQIVNAPQAAVAAAAAPTLASVGDMASVVGGASVYLARGWAVLNNNFGSSQLVYGRDYTMTTSVNKTDVTAGTTFNWSFPVVPVGPGANATIKAFPEVIFGVSPYGGGKNPADTAVTFPVQVGSISSLKADFDLAFNSANAGNNVAFDIWLTNKPNGDASTISNEIMVWLHAGSLQPMGQRIGNFVDSDFSASIYYAPESHYIALVANSDTPKGTLDIGKIVAHLAALGIVSPSEYIASVELGAEVASGAGSLTIRNLDLDVRTLNADGTITVKQVTGAGTSVSTLSAGTTLNGTSGNDVLTGKAPADVLKGGAGNDVYYVTDAHQKVIEAVGGGTDTVIAKVSYALTPGQEIENVYADSVSSRSSINLTGNEFNNILNGNAGDNILNGGAGNDTLVANGGRDTLIGGTGNDVFIVDDPAQRVIEAVGEGNDTVIAKCSYALQAGQEVENMYADSVASRAPINLTGNEFNNVLNGNAGDNVLDGRAGNDTLIANGGRDTLIGGTGNDVFIVDDPAQRVIEAVGEGNDTMIAKCSYALQAGQEVENMYADSVASRAPINLTGNEFNNILNGNAGNNVLDGGAGNDILVGNAGDDILIGGKGADVLLGGAGNDIFRFYKGDFGSQAGGWDRIADWNQGDRIDLSTARDMVAGNAGFSFVGAGGFTHHAGEVAVSVQGGMTWVSIDSDGDGIADAKIALNGSLRLQASDFLF